MVSELTVASPRPSSQIQLVSHLAIGSKDKTLEGGLLTNFTQIRRLRHAHAFDHIEPRLIVLVTGDKGLRVIEPATATASASGRSRMEDGRNSTGLTTSFIYLSERISSLISTLPAWARISATPNFARALHRPRPR